MEKVNRKKEDTYPGIWYANMIIEMVKNLDAKFLRQIYIIMKTHIEKRGH